MVVREPEYCGELISKGRVIVPGHYVHNSKKQIGANVFLSNNNKRCENDVNKTDKLNIAKTNKYNKNEMEHNYKNKKHVSCQTEQIVLVDSCVWNDQQHISEECVKNDSELWNLQFDRWWGWNWLRKRKELINKFGFKPDSKKCAHKKAEHKKNINADNINRTTKKTNKDKVSSGSTSSLKKHEKHNCAICSLKLFHPNLLPIPPLHTCYLNKCDKGRRCKNPRLKKEEFEGWIKDLSSTTSFEANDVEKSPACKIRKVQCAKRNAEYLLLRLKHLNSLEFIEKSKQNKSSQQKPTRIQKKYCNDRVSSKFEKQNENKADVKNDKENFQFISPISDRHYSLHETNELTSKTQANNTTHLHPIEVYDEQLNNITKLQFGWLNDYNSIKKEHNELLSTICQVLCNTSASKLTDQDIKINANNNQTNLFEKKDLLSNNQNSSINNNDNADMSRYLKISNNIHNIQSNLSDNLLQNKNIKGSKTQDTSLTIKKESFCINQELFSDRNNINDFSKENIDDHHFYQTADDIITSKNSENIIKEDINLLSAEKMYMNSDNSNYDPYSINNSNNVTSYTSFKSATGFTLENTKISSSTTSVSKNDSEILLSSKTLN